MWNFFFGGKRQGRAPQLGVTRSGRPVTPHRCESATSLRLMPQYKSPTVPKYRPVVTPHHCDFGDDDKSSSGRPKRSPWWWFLFAMLVVGVAAAGVAGASVMAGRGKKNGRRCLEVNC